MIARCTICGKRREDLAGHMHRHHSDQDIALNVMASPSGMHELEKFCQDPAIAATMKLVDITEVIGALEEAPIEARQTRPMAASMQEARIYSPRRVSRKEQRTGGKPSAHELMDQLVPAPALEVMEVTHGIISSVTEQPSNAEMREPGRSRTEVIERAPGMRSSVAGRRVASAQRQERRPEKRGLRRRPEDTVREFGWEPTRRRDGEKSHTSEPRWVTRESYVEYRAGEVIARGESARYEY
jgi:hypothetical protein